MEINLNDYARLVSSIAGKFSKVHEFDDLVQEGYIGLLEAQKRYDPSRGVKFSSYAYPWIRKYVREAAYKRLENTNHESCFLEELHSGEPMQRKPSYGNVAVMACVRSIGEEEQTILAQRALLELTLKEVGEKRGCSGARIHQIEVKIKQKLQTRLRNRLGSGSL